MGRQSSRRTRQRSARDAGEPVHRGRNRAVIVCAIAFAATAGVAWWSSSTHLTVSRDGSPAWSPDNTRLAFYSERDGNGEIYVMHTDGSHPTRLTRTASDEGYPSWSPDGRTITFDTDRDGNFEIYAMNVDGTNVQRLTNHPARDVSASWSPDGQQIAFMSDRDGGFDIYVMDADGANVTRRTTTGTSWFPVWSHDGMTLAFHVGRDVHLASSGGSSVTRLTTDPENGMFPSWSPDGSRIAFMSWRNGRTELFLMNRDGSNQTRLLAMDRGDAIDPRWSPDGSRVAFVHVPGGLEGTERAIFVVNVDGSGLRCVSK